MGSLLLPTVGFNALITLSIESGDDGSLESLSKSSVSGLKISNDINFGTNGAAESRRTIGNATLFGCCRDWAFRNFGIGGRSLMICLVIFDNF